ncbi:MAG: hypothetical protein AB7E70_18875 [Hyphomicrobiaceae bacterium]
MSGWSVALLAGRRDGAESDVASVLHGLELAVTVVEAIDAAAEALEAADVELIVLDVDGLAMDGPSLLACVRSHANGAHIPVLLIGSPEQTAAAAALLEAGATTALLGSVEAKTLSVVIENLLRCFRESCRLREDLQLEQAGARASKLLLDSLAVELDHRLAQVVDAAEQAMLAGTISSREDPTGWARAALQQSTQARRVLNSAKPYLQLISSQVAVDTTIASLRRIVADSLGDIERLSIARSVGIEIGDVPDLHVECDRPAIRRAISATITTAMLEAPVGATVLFDSAMTPDDGVAIRVATFAEVVEPAEPERSLAEALRERAKIPGEISEISSFDLVLARTVVEAHGGSIERRVRPGEGVTITLVLPSELVFHHDGHGECCEDEGSTAYGG